jgi:hypothetical protein
MNLDARLRKLEGKHKKVLRCLWCQYSLVDTPPSDVRRQKADPNSVLKTQCYFCGTSFNVPLNEKDEQEREAVRLYYSHPIKQYTDERVHAAYFWLGLQVQLEALEQEKKALTVSEPPNKKKAALKEEAYRFTMERLEEFKRQAGGERKFPIDETLERLEAEYPTEWQNITDDMVREAGFECPSSGSYTYKKMLSRVNERLLRFKQLEALEVFLWGEMRLHTKRHLIKWLAARLRLGDKVRSEIEKEREAQRQREEESARRDEERRAAALKREDERRAANPAVTSVSFQGELVPRKFEEEKPKPEPLPEFDEKGRKRVELPVVPGIEDPTQGLRPGQWHKTPEERGMSISEHQRMIDTRSSFGG